MFGSRRWQFKASSVSVCILRGSLNYATIMGIICFSIKSNGGDNRLVAQNRKWTILIIRVCIYVACGVYTLVIQFCYADRVVDLVNSFLGLFQRIHALRGSEDVGFGRKWVLTLLLLKVIGLMYESCYLIPGRISDINVYYILTTICELYNTVNASVMLNVYFVAYLSIGVIYDQVNGYVRHELRQQLNELKTINGTPASRRKLKAAAQRLDECLETYDGIPRVVDSFHRLFEFPLCVVLMFKFLSIGSIAFFVMKNLGGVSLWFMVIKILLDILLLTVAVHIARSNSRVIRWLSVENYYITNNRYWHMKLEMFLSRLNYKEFRVRPLGLFEVSNELILIYMSGLVTYLTYIIQYDMQRENL
ncbi:putative gustatory receptor 93c [Drosophila navojoa]|uniref:putative gustatory receptor 93c n=1 Tax=Drosophila navojoa TaxID=7232 RepID=UPI0008467E65|nr:putative gustatory receptor 93c [Drosophila navojoa]